MQEYNCTIKYGNQVVFRATTTAVSDKKAMVNIWWRYAKSLGVPKSRFGIFVTNKKKDGFVCQCQEEQNIPIDPDPVPKSGKQLEFSFESSLRTALNKVF